MCPLPHGSIVVLVAFKPTHKGRSGKMSKAMPQAIRGQNLRVKMAISALAVLLALTLVAVLQPAPTAGDRDANPASRTMRMEGKGGSSLAQDPVHRHVEVVERLGGGSLR
jgi:hypothetical protein